MSTINFDHSKKSFHEALGIDEEQSTLLANTLAEISTLIISRERDNNSMKQSEVAELLANTLSYRELLSLATQGLADRTETAIGEFENVLRLAQERGVSFKDKEAITEIMHEVVREKREESRTSIKSIAIDAEDIDGSLDRANVPEEIRPQIKARILEEMMRRMKEGFDDGDDQ